MMRTPLVVGALAAALLCAGETASAFIYANTIDAHATYKQEGMRLRVTGPIGCTRGERVSIRATVTQPATGARPRKGWQGRCTGEIQHWQVRARARPGTRFRSGSARVCALAKTRSGDRVTGTRRWCERVKVSSGFDASR